MSRSGGHVAGRIGSPFLPSVALHSAGGFGKPRTMVASLNHSALVSKVNNSDWLSYHIYSVDNEEHFLLKVVAPLVSLLISKGQIDRFYFVRYSDERGRHVRLRLRIVSELETANDLIRRFVEVQSAGTVKPLVLAYPLETESERYGGGKLFLDSMEFFALSSHFALAYLARVNELARGQRMAAALKLLMAQACGLAKDMDELPVLLDYFAGARERMAVIVARADEVMERNGGQISQIFRNQTERLASRSQILQADCRDLDIDFFRAACSLSRRLHAVERDIRLMVGRNQMHMTANRIGLENAEEMYITHLLCRAFEVLSKKDFFELGGVVEKKSLEVCYDLKTLLDQMAIEVRGVLLPRG